MDILKKLDKDTIIICSNDNKNKILNECFKLKKIIDFKIMNLNEFIKKMIFDYDTKTIYYIMKKNNISYENALVYLKSLYFVFEELDNKKLKKLFDLKKELLDNQLLIIDEFFKESIKDKKIIFYEIDTDYKYINKLTSDYEVINKTYNSYSDKKIYSFETIDEEINFVASSICSLIKDGIPIQNIKLLNLPKEYEFNIKNIFHHYGLYIDLNTTSLYSTYIGKYFLDNLCEDINITIDKLKEKFDIEDVNKIINICNKYTWCDNFLEIRECLIYELKHTKKTSKKYDNVVEIGSIDSTSDNCYYFLLGFNQENFPKVYKDDAYIDDKLCEILNIENSIEKNIRIRNNIINNILNTKNLTLTYKRKTNFGEYYLSNLNDELNFEIEKKKLNYSLTSLKIDYGKKLDKFIKYGVKDASLDLLYSNLDIMYGAYNNRFKGINITNLKEHLNNKLLLSYTGLDNFYKCQFSYYVNNILKLASYEETFSTYIGSLIHYVLSNIFKEDNFDKIINEFDKEFKLTKKEEFFLSKIKEELKFTTHVIKKQKYLTGFDNELYEQKIYLDKSNDMNITLMGIIDKIMYLEKNNKTYISVIDYKTGFIDTNLKYTHYGLQLQLPIYAYLILKSNLFNNPVISGLYYQKLLTSEIKATDRDSYIKEKEKNLKLDGLSTNDESILGLFDSTYENSELIKSMKRTSNGFYAYSKVFSENELSELMNTVESKIDEAVMKICNGDFKINPKKIGKDNVSCKYCKFKDICYMTEDNVEVIEEGDENA